MSALSLVLLAGVCLGRRNDYPASILQDEIKSLPGLDADTMRKYSMFSGYINVDKANNRSIFYWFIESLDSPAKDPVALWTNGGPGCSGLSGMLTEQGPFRPTEALNLYVNNYSWVNVANMLFIEAPAGVGFSFSDVEKDYTTGDNQTAIDNYHMIQGWLSAFPNYKDNDFFITSESYGGHYMPTLAQQIILGNNAGGIPKVNFKGFFVGNPYTDPEENKKGQYDTWFGHQLVSAPTWKNWYNKCLDGDSKSIINVACDEAEVQMNAEIGNKIDPYALDFPVCNSAVNERTWFMKHVIQDALKRPVPGVYGEYVRQLEELLDSPTPDDDMALGMEYEACETNWMSKYLNQASVQTAIHAKPVRWTMCSTKVSYSSDSMANPMEPLYKWLIENGDIRITIVSGDDDSVCGTLGTQSWIWTLGYEVDSEYDWKVWFDATGQTGGYMTKFTDALNFVTVHSAGHMVPETQPARSLEVFRMYLKGTI